MSFTELHPRAVHACPHSPAATPQTGCPGPQLMLMALQGAARRPLEQFIARRFEQAYGARVRSFMPQLFGLSHWRGEWIAAFGLRPAQGDTLFLEQYLDQPVERVIAARFGLPVSRSEIAEVGNLAGATPGALRDLIPALTSRLHRDGYRWVVFTGAARLCNAFTRLGLPLELLGTASVERLPVESRTDWGRYYQESPAVMAGDVTAGFHSLAADLDEHRTLRRRLAPVFGVGAP